ncbi:zinc finger CCCH domain-containing protein 39-like [Hibiscus syriacus]|uniref:zinc finger CCCH domain-containing protein 39-like n=1 Tax=Hibiscus syriacus TaxID=106335 RepID=UPI001924DACF|nr:zinc finger CCCH domain-containing protein 39-like [Hibiscus syriacus]
MDIDGGGGNNDFSIPEDSDSMDSNFYNESNKLNVLKSSIIPKLTTTPVRSRGNSYSSPENLIKYLRSNSVSSSGNSGSTGKSCFRSSVSPQSEKTPLKVVDEDVFVMDGVLVASDSSIIGSGSSSSGSTGFYKSEICRAWEELGHCRYRSKCQFEHGKEDVRPTCFSFRIKSEVSINFFYISIDDM